MKKSKSSKAPSRLSGPGKIRSAEVAEFLVHSRIFRQSRIQFLKLLCYYFSIDLREFSDLPKKGPAIVIANHSGFLGFDALLLAYAIQLKTKRNPRIMAHRAYFDLSTWLRNVCFSLNLREPHVLNAVETLKHGNILIVFPEGEEGNFKSSIKRYQIQKFHTGFLRLAQQAQVPIYACLIVGAEETHLNLGSINLNRWISHCRIPLPLNIFPLPAGWKMRTLKPFAPPSKGASLPKIASQMRKGLQLALNEEVRRRKVIFPAFGF